MTLAERIRSASDEALTSDRMLDEIVGVLSAIREVAVKNTSFSRALPYTLSDKHPRIISAIPGLKKRNEAEDNKIITLLERVRQGEVEFWNPNTPTLYDVKQSRFLASSGYYCIALAFALDNAQTHHHILRRFASLAVFNLTRSGRTAKSICTDLMRAKMHPEKSSDQLLKDITGFVNAGQRYKMLADELGGLGSLFFIPAGQQLWEKYLPKDGPCRKQIIKILEVVGVPNRSIPHHQLAENLIRQGADIGFNTTSEIPWETISSERNSERQLPEDNLDLEEERGTTARISGPGGVQNNPIGHDGHMSRSRATVISGGYNVIGKRRKISADTAQPDIVREYERYSSSSVATVAAKGSEGLEVGLRQPSEELDQIPNGNNESEDTTEMVRTLGATDIMQWPMGGESLPHAVFPHSHELISVAAHSQGSNSTCEAVHGSNGYFANDDTQLEPASEVRNMSRSPNPNHVGRDQVTELTQLSDYLGSDDIDDILQWEHRWHMR